MDDSLDLLNNWMARKKREDSFVLPPHAVPMHILLQNPHKDFAPEFLTGLYALELAMIENGFDPDAFAIGKATIGGGYYPGVRPSPFTYDYTITFHGDSYSVRKEGDMMFLAYFSTLCLSEEHEPLASASNHVARHVSFFSKIKDWLETNDLPGLRE